LPVQVVNAVPASSPTTTLKLPPEAMELPALTPALKLLVPAEAVMISAPLAKVTSAAKFTAPSTSNTSRLVVPSISISPDISKEAPVRTPATVSVEAISTAPSISTTSKLVVPSTSMSPEMSRDVPVKTPVTPRVPETDKLTAVVVPVRATSVSKS